jgi:transcriptional regulator with XRE-family HTH domain
LSHQIWATFGAKIGVLKQPKDTVVTPFGLFLQDIRRDRRLAQKQLAGLLEVDQSYLSGLESGRKGVPPVSMVERLKDGLKLNEEEVRCLDKAVLQSRRKVEIPLRADPAEYTMIHRVADKLGHLCPAQIRAIEEIISIREA